MPARRRRDPGRRVRSRVLHGQRWPRSHVHRAAARDRHGQRHRHDDRPHQILARTQGRHERAHLGGAVHRLQGHHWAARAGQRRIVPRVEGRDPRRQHADGALPRADGRLEPRIADDGRYDRQSPCARDAGTHAGRALGHARRRASRSSAAIRKPAPPSCCKRSKAAAGARVRMPTARRRRCRSAKATCATRRSKRSS